MKSKLVSLAAILASSVLASVSFADIWDGGGANNSWMTIENWNPNAAPVAGDPLTFPTGVDKLSNTNNFPNLTNFQSLTFTGANYTLSGNSVNLSTGIDSNQAVGTNTIHIDLQLAQDQRFTVLNDNVFLNITGDIDLNGFDLTIDGTGNPVLNGAISGAGAITKDGNGFSRLSGNNSYSGGTNVDDGILEVNNSSGSATGTGPVIVASGAQLQGAGSISGEVLIKGGAELAPGDEDPAILTLGDNLILDPESSLIIQIDGSIPDTEYSGVDVTGTVVLDDCNFRMALGPQVQAGDDFTIIDNDASDEVTGNFAGLDEGDTFRLVGNDNIGFKITYEGGDGNDVVLTSIPTISISDVTVNEPSSGTTQAHFTVTLTEESNDTITVKFETDPGSATAPGDYLAVNNVTVTFNPGDTSETISITVNSDNVSEAAENFVVGIFNPTNASIADDEGTGTINPPSTSGGNGNGNGNGNPSGNNPGTGNNNGDPSAAAEGGCSLAAATAPVSGFVAWALFGLGLLAWLRIKRSVSGVYQVPRMSCTSCGAMASRPGGTGTPMVSI